MVMSTMMTSLAEGMCLGSALGLDNEALIKVQYRTPSKSCSSLMIHTVALCSTFTPPHMFSVAFRPHLSHPQVTLVLSAASFVTGQLYLTHDVRRRTLGTGDSDLLFLF